MTKVLSILLFSFHAMAGQEVGNGVPNYKVDNHTMWYTDNQRVNYCIEVAKDFGLSHNEVNLTLQKAIKIWSKYINGRIHSSLSKPSVNYSFQGNCSSFDADLQFYFGVKDSFTRRYIAELDTRVAGVYKTQIAPQSRGFVWLEKKFGISDSFPDWSKKNHLLGILLHELGHINGCDHFDGTIMDKRLAEWLEHDKTDRLDQIDFHRVLYFNFDRNASYGGKLITTAGGEKTSDKDHFRRLVGREPSGKIVAKLVFKKSENHPRLIISDNLGSRSIELFVNIYWSSTLDVSFSSGVNIFAYRDQGQPPDAGASFGYLVDADGDKMKIKVLVNTNPWRGPINIQYQPQKDSSYIGFFYELFRTDPLDVVN